MIRRAWNLLGDILMPATLEPAPPPMPLAIEAAGLCCAVGYQLAAAACALRAGMDHFRESDFVTRRGEKITTAGLPDDLVGTERLQRWVEFAIRDAARHLDHPHALFDADRTAIVVLIADANRAHSDTEATAELTLAALRVLHEQVHASLAGANVAAPPIDVITRGQAGLVDGLLRASQLLTNPALEQVLLIGVDSYLTSADIGEALAEGRLIVPGNSDGFIAGEAAAALVLRRRLADSSVCITGYARADELGRPDGSVPSLGKGLTEAIRGACAHAGIEAHQLEFQLGDQHGEQFFSREAANAMARVMHGGSRLAQLTLADKIGETGAAGGPAMLAWLWHDMLGGNSPGAAGLVHLANVHGLRCAAVVQNIPHAHHGG
ncbi:MAG: hypothetical protein RLZZ618_4160 [Pseudomonadota bacterium]|jgi:3-oxoacyl-[acyl-carrier-protein] synthase-1